MDPSLPAELRQAIRDCRDRGLVIASKWAAELLNAIPMASRPPRSTLSFPTHLHPFHSSTPTRPFHSPSGGGRGGGPRPSLSTMSPSDFVPQPAPSIPPPLEEEVDWGEEDTYELGRAYFEAKELERAAWALRGCRSNKAVFLSLYAQYLSADKRMQEGLPNVLGSVDDRHILAPSLTSIMKELGDPTDAFLLYLKGLILFRLHKRPEAVECFILSVRRYPCNWSCWLALAGCIKSNEQLEAILAEIPAKHPFATCFEIHIRLDLHTASDVVGDLIVQLEQNVFSIASTPEGKRDGKAWVWGESMKGMVAYHLRDFEMAEALFDQVQQLDPFRLDDIDIYSNMLYVMPKLAKLAQLAKQYCIIDRNRAETCCLVGNFYSSRGEHPKAIQYFKRSLQLNRDYLPAWTLMGHEYVEMKNSHAAIEAYRRAVDVNPRDYRAWYGLGQTYELLDMGNYAIQYYNKATALRPYDSRMWLALAQVYETTGRTTEAIKCHQRALVGAEADSTASILATLARLYDAARRPAEAAASHRRLLTAWAASAATGGGGPPPTGEMVRSWLYLAKYELKGGDAAGEGGEPNWGLVQQYLSNIVKHNVPEKDEAERMLKGLPVI